MTKPNDMPEAVPSTEELGEDELAMVTGGLHQPVDYPFAPR